MINESLFGYIRENFVIKDHDEESLFYKFQDLYRDSKMKRNEISFTTKRV